MVALFANKDELSQSRHARIACVQCHTGGDPADATRPCKTMSARVDCSICHAETVEQYRESKHGQLLAQGSPDAPECHDCHSPHGTLSRNDSNSPTFSRNVPALCGRCHRVGEKAAVRYKGAQKNIVENYLESIHGKGLMQSGLTVTANCADCHTRSPRAARRAIRARPSIRPTSRRPARSATGASTRCTRRASTRSSVTKTDKKLPVCSDCHSAHSIQRTDLSNFRLHIMDQCGRCHQKIAETYFDTFHGKVSKLGYLTTAKCYDCHGAHDILPVTDPRSRLSHANIVQTCGKCHAGSHRQFAGYLTHATHHDPKRYPFLFYTFWGMTTLLVGTLTVAGAHTALWLQRSLGRAAPRTRPGGSGGRTRVRPALLDVPAQPPSDGDRQLPRPRAHGHAAEVFVRGLGEGPRARARRLPVGGRHPPPLRHRDLHVFRACTSSISSGSAGRAGRAGAATSSAATAWCRTSRTGGNSSARSGGS